jgi:hypothetical protein
MGAEKKGDIIDLRSFTFAETLGPPASVLRAIFLCAHIAYELVSAMDQRIQWAGVSHVWNNFPQSSCGVDGSQSSSAQIICTSLMTCLFPASTASVTSLHIE